MQQVVPSERKRHRPLHIAIAFVAGFASAFALLIVVMMSGPLVGNIMVGTVPLSMENPTVAGAGLANAQMQTMLKSLGSFWFWSLTTIIGTIFSIKILQMFRGGSALEM